MTLKDDSKCGYAYSPTELEKIKTGSLQRIADAVEKMAQQWTELIKQRDAAITERDRYYQWWREERDQKTKLERSANARVAALRGVIKRLEVKCSR